jgi:tetratricopeptide (TPR) repeat protein
LLELDQLYAKLNMPVEDRFQFLDGKKNIVEKRDDLFTTYVTLLNLQGRYQDAYDHIMGRHFHPWEGGEGKVTTQYAIALTELGKKALQHGEPEKAIELFQKALVFPHNLGEGKLEGAKDNNIYYYLGIAYRQTGDETKALECLTRAALGDEEPSSAMYYNDQPADLILYEGLANLEIGDEVRASSRFHKLITYGEKHYYDHVKIDYFAVSLPDLQLFEDNLDKRNRIHCNYLIGLGYLGLGEKTKAKEFLEKVLEADKAHQGAAIHVKLLG